MLSKEMLERFYVELTNPDELGLTDSRLRIVFDMALRSLDAGWVSVEERLPKEYEHVLIFVEGSFRPVREGYLSRMTYNDETGKDFDLPLFADATEQFSDEGSPSEFQITHWMPLPAAPSAQRDDAMADAAISGKR